MQALVMLVGFRYSFMLVYGFAASNWRYGEIPLNIVSFLLLQNNNKSVDKE